MFVLRGKVKLQPPVHRNWKPIVPDSQSSQLAIK